MNPRLDGGWLVVDYAGPDLATCYIAAGVRNAPTQWRPAYKSWRGSTRVLQVRPPAGTGAVKVWTRVGSTVTLAGTVTL